MSVAAIGYNSSRWVNELLEEYKDDGPSFSVHLHEGHWSINNSAASHFLYTSPISSLLDDIRAHRIPNDFLSLFDQFGVQYFEGCLIVALYDHRPRVSKLAESRGPDDAGVDAQLIVLQPTHETLYADIKCIAEAERAQGRPWTDQQALELEARILNASSQPLCLEPDINVTRIANRIIRATTPAVPRTLKRKRGDFFGDEDDDKLRAQRAKLMQFMNPRAGRAFTQRLLTEGRLDFDHVRESINLSRGGPAPGVAVPPPRQDTPTPQPASATPAQAAPSSGKGKNGPQKKSQAKADGLGQEEKPKNTIKLNAGALANVKRDSGPTRTGTPVQPPANAPGPSNAQPNTTALAQTSHLPASNPQNGAVQVGGMGQFQATVLPNNFLQQPPAGRGVANVVASAPSPAAGMVGGKRPGTPQQAHAAAAMPGAAPTATPVNMPGRVMQSIPLQIARYHVNFNNQMVPLGSLPPNLQQQYLQAMMAAQAGRGRGAPQSLAQNMFASAISTARPGHAASGVMPMAPAPAGTGDATAAGAAGTVPPAPNVGQFSMMTNMPMANQPAALPFSPANLPPALQAQFAANPQMFVQNWTAHQRRLAAAAAAAAGRGIPIQAGVAPAAAQALALALATMQANPAGSPQYLAAQQQYTMLALAQQQQLQMMQNQAIQQRNAAQMQPPPGAQKGPGQR
ncbi:Spt20 family-domain-containing protein [Auriculariales sp. MPI-PUGE-AT-0066]|nr:Spt20 family-domain-containing protein [Auriculariales sp. MPI-PUGE-AT-0066]